MGSGSAYNYIAMKEAIQGFWIRRQVMLVILKLESLWVLVALQ